MFFILVPFLKRAPCIIIHLARNAEKGGGVLMSIILPNLNHSFVPDSGSVSGFRISGFSIRPTALQQKASQIAFMHSNQIQIIVHIDPEAGKLIKVIRGFSLYFNILIFLCIENSFWKPISLFELISGK